MYKTRILIALGIVILVLLLAVLLIKLFSSIKRNKKSKTMNMEYQEDYYQENQPRRMIDLTGIEPLLLQKKETTITH